MDITQSVGNSTSVNRTKASSDVKSEVNLSGLEVAHESITAVQQDRQEEHVSSSTVVSGRAVASTRETPNKVLELQPAVSALEDQLMQHVKDSLRAFELSWSQSMRDGRIAQIEQAMVVNPNQKKRPPEPPIELDYNRNEELNAMVVQGRVEADVAALKAGYLGGDSTGMVLLHFFFAYWSLSQGLDEVRLEGQG